MSTETLEPLAGVAGATWPVALTMAAVAVRERVRDRRRRRLLNEGLHELRRPLQALVLARPKQPDSEHGPDPLELALAALRELDHTVNGAAPLRRRRPVEARMLAIAAAERWRSRARAAGRRVTVRWHCGDELCDVDPVRVAQALDNLIANALEHGGGPIAIEGIRRSGAVQLSVRDRGGRWRRRTREHRNPRRGHGLRVAAAAADDNGGTLRIRSAGRGTVAALVLPLLARGTARGEPG